MLWIIFFGILTIYYHIMHYFHLLLVKEVFGKSYQAKKFVAKRFINKGKQFVYIRRYKTELKEAMIKKGEHIFWKQVQYDDELVNHKYNNDNELMYIDGKVARFCYTTFHC